MEGDIELESALLNPNLQQPSEVCELLKKIGVLNDSAFCLAFACAWKYGGIIPALEYAAYETKKENLLKEIKKLEIGANLQKRLVLLKESKILKLDGLEIAYTPLGDECVVLGMLSECILENDVGKFGFASVITNQELKDKIESYLKMEGYKRINFKS